MSARIGARLPEREALALIRALLRSAGAGLHPAHVQLPDGGPPIVRPAPPSPGYRAPEQQGTPTVQGDVYIAGTLLFELLSGERLGALPDREILHASALRRALDPLEIDPGTRQLLQIMLDFRPEARLDPALLISELDALIASLPGGAPEWPSAAPDVAPNAAPELAPAPSAPALKPADTLKVPPTPPFLRQYGKLLFLALLGLAAVGAICGGGGILLAAWLWR